MLISGRVVSSVLEKGWRFPGIGPPPTPWSFDSALELAPLGVSFSLLIEDPSKWTCPPSWTHLSLIGLCCVLGLCHTFKSCALPPSLLLENDLVLRAALRSIHHP